MLPDLLSYSNRNCKLSTLLSIISLMHQDGTHPTSTNRFRILLGKKNNSFSMMESVDVHLTALRNPSYQSAIDSINTTP